MKSFKQIALTAFQLTYLKREKADEGHAFFTADEGYMLIFNGRVVSSVEVMQANTSINEGNVDVIRVMYNKDDDNDYDDFDDDATGDWKVVFIELGV